MPFIFDNGRPWRQQYDFNLTQSADITPWATGTSLPGTLIDSQVIVTDSMVHILGGYYNGSFSNGVRTAPINTDGTLGTWAAGTNLPGTSGRSQAVVTKNRVYLLGGNYNSQYSTAVLTAPINTDGTLGTWATDTSLPGGNRSWAQAVVTKDRVYLIGGYTGTIYLDTVLTAPINQDGTIGTWATTTSLPGTLAYSQAIVTDSRVYLLGGNYNGSYSSVVLTAPINEDGTLGTWATGTNLPGTLGSSQAIVTNDAVYLLGGYYQGSYKSTVLTAPINTNGTLGTWTTGTSLPGTMGKSQAIVTSSKIYMLGGYYNGANASTVLVADFAGGLNDYLDKTYTIETGNAQIASSGGVVAGGEVPITVVFRRDVAIASSGGAVIGGRGTTSKDLVGSVFLVEQAPSISMEVLTPIMVDIFFRENCPAIEICTTANVAIAEPLPELRIDVQTPAMIDISITDNAPTISAVADTVNVISIGIIEQQPELRLAASSGDAAQTIDISVRESLPTIGVFSFQTETINIFITDGTPKIRCNIEDDLDFNPIQYSRSCAAIV